MKKIISESEYFNALRTVLDYHEQIGLKTTLSECQHTSVVRLSEFLNSVELTTRINSVLAEYIHQYGDIRLNSVTKYNFMRIRNGGTKSWNKFIEIKNQYDIKSLRNTQKRPINKPQTMNEENQNSV